MPAEMEKWSGPEWKLDRNQFILSICINQVKVMETAYKIHNRRLRLVFERKISLAASFVDCTNKRKIKTHCMHVARISMSTINRKLHQHRILMEHVPSISIWKRTIPVPFSFSTGSRKVNRININVYSA